MGRKVYNFNGEIVIIEETVIGERRARVSKTKRSFAKNEHY